MNRDCGYLLKCAAIVFFVVMAVPVVWAQVAEHKDEKKPSEFTPPVITDAPYAVGEIVRHKGSGHRGQVIELNWITDYTKRPSVEKVISFRVRFWSLPPQAPAFETVPMQEFELEPDKK